MGSDRGGAGYRVYMVAGLLVLCTYAASVSAVIALMYALRSLMRFSQGAGEEN